MEHLSRHDALALMAKPAAKVNKYRAERMAVPDRTGKLRSFASKKEGRRAAALMLAEQSGIIRALEFQVRFKIHVNGVLICTYVADFRYVDVATGETIVEDAKGVRTPAFAMKAKLMRAVLGVAVLET